eukprot:5601649-Alexandrium_andersonii.AAC.1
MCIRDRLALQARAYGAPCSLVADQDATTEQRRWLAAVLHQASFRVYTWEGLPPKGAPAAAAAIARAARRGDTGADPEDDEPRDGPV